MAEREDLIVSFGDDEPLVEFPLESATVSVPLTEVGEGLYRLDGVPFGIESVGFGDVIEAEVVEEGRVRFICIAERGGWRTFDYMLSEEMVERVRMESLIKEVDARGAHWERLFGGLLFICVPPDSDFDPTPQVMGL